MRKRTLAREYALKMLYQVEMCGDPVGAVIQSFWDKQKKVDPDVRGFADEIVLGTTDNVEAIDQKITESASNWSLDRMAIIDRNILRFAVFELMYLADVPPKVSVNEAINLAKKYSQDDSGKFVNGILDKLMK